MGLALPVNWLALFFVSPELCSETDYVITHSVGSMYVECSLYVCSTWYFAKFIIVSTYNDVFPWDLLGHNDPWVESTHVTSTDGSKVI